MSQAPKIAVSKSALAPDTSTTFSGGPRKKLTLMGANSTTYRRLGIQILGTISHVHKSTPSRDTKGDRLYKMALHQGSSCASTIGKGRSVGVFSKLRRELVLRI